MAKTQVPPTSAPVTPDAFARVIAIHNHARDVLNAAPDELEGTEVHDKLEEAYIASIELVDRTAAPSLTELLAKAEFLWAEGDGAPPWERVSPFVDDLRRIAHAQNARSRPVGLAPVEKDLGELSARDQIDALNSSLSTLLRCIWTEMENFDGLYPDRRSGPGLVIEDVRSIVSMAQDMVTKLNQLARRPRDDQRMVA